MKSLAQIGTLSPPPGTVPVGGGDPSGRVADIIRNGIALFIIVSFIIALFMMILAGVKFATAGGDEKSVASAWAQIYWGLIGLVVVVGAFAIIRLAETFFSVDIISGSFMLPR